MNDAAYNANDVIQIIHRLHDTSSAPPSLAEQKQLQQALFAAQRSPDAWSLGGQILSGQDPDVNVRFFGAHTLTVKIARDWETLPKDHWNGLKDAMLNWLCESARQAYPPPGSPSVAGERIVLRKLAVAITSLSFRLVPTDWPNWLLETIMRLSASGCSRVGIYEVLTLVIEEVGRADLIGSKKVQYDQVVSDVAPRVAETIGQSLSQENDASADEVNAALKCLTGWISKRDFNRDLLATLYPLVLNHLLNANTCVMACACTEDILLDSQFATETRVDPLLDFCASSEVGTMYANAEQEQDVDEVTLALFKLTIAIFEHSYTKIIEQLTSPRTITLLQRLLLITSFPGYYAQDETVSDLGLPIWAYLQEEIADNGIIATESGFGDPRWPTVKDVFEALCTGLLRKVEYPSESEYSTWPKDIRQNFGRYCIDVGDCLINCFYVLRGAMLGRLVALVNAQIQELSSARSSSSNALQAAIYALSSVQEAVPEEESEHLPQLFSGPLLSFLQQIPPGSETRLRCSILRLIEAYASWFKLNKAFILPAVEAAVANLSQSDASQAAALALSALCDSCRSELISHVASFAELVRNLEGRIPNDDYIKVLGSVAAVIQALPAHDLVAPVVTLVENSIAKLAAGLNSSSKDEAKQICLFQLASLTACARSLSEPEDEILSLDSLNEATDEAAKAKIVTTDPRVEGLRNQIFEGIKALSTAFRGDLEVSQALSTFFKACTSTHIATPLSLDTLRLSEILSYLIEQAVEVTWLSIAAVVLSRMGKREIQPQEQSTLRAVIGRILQSGIQFLQPAGVMEQNPDIVQSFMDWAMSALVVFARVLTTLPDLTESLLLLAIQALDLQERVALQKTIQLLTAMTNEASSESPASELFMALQQRHGRSTLQLTLAGVGGRLPRSNTGYLAELLLAFSRRLPNETRIWLKELFSQDGFPSHRVSQEQKDRYAKSITSARNLRKLKDATDSFAIVCRGLEGTSYTGS